MQHLFIIAGLLLSTVLPSPIESFQSDSLDTDMNVATNIKIKQTGSGNTAHVRQTGSSSPKKAEIKTSGTGNEISIHVDNSPLTTNFKPMDDSNQLITFSEGTLRLLSFTTLSESFLQEQKDFSNFSFILVHPKEPLNIHQSQNGVTIYR